MLAPLARIDTPCAPGITIRYKKIEYVPWSRIIKLTTPRIEKRIYVAPNTPLSITELANVIRGTSDPLYFDLFVDGDEEWRTYILESVKVMYKLHHLLKKGHYYSPNIIGYNGGAIVTIAREVMRDHFEHYEPGDPTSHCEAVIGEIPKPPMEIPGLYTMISLDDEHFMIVDFFEYMFKNAESLREIATPLIDKDIFCYYPLWIRMKLAQFQTKKEHKRYTEVLDELDAYRVHDGKRSLSNGVIDIIASYAADAYDCEEFHDTMRDLRYPDISFRSS